MRLSVQNSIQIRSQAVFKTIIFPSHALATFPSAGFALLLTLDISDGHGAHQTAGPCAASLLISS